MLDTRSASVSVVGFISVATVTTSLIGAPGIGVILALVIIGVVLWLRRSGLHSIGFICPVSWMKTLALGLILGTLFQLASLVLLDPLIEYITNTPTDLSEFESMRGNAGVLLNWLLVVWILVVFVEEIVFRGFLMTELKKLLGEAPTQLYMNLILTSALFGLAHWYQGPSGVLSTGIIGLVLGGIFIRSGFTLWLPIFVHGFIDTLGLTLIYLNADSYFKELWL